jgi:hypothetical protein
VDLHLVGGAVADPGGHVRAVVVGRIDGAVVAEHVDVRRREAELVAQDAIRELGVLDVAPVADLAGPQQRVAVVVDEPGVVRDLRPVDLGIDVPARLGLRQRLVEVLRASATSATSGGNIASTVWRSEPSCGEWNR